jgi:glycosidase
MLPSVTHTAALPYCCYDKNNGKIALRVIASAEIESITLLYGDPYHWDTSNSRGPQWRFAESALFRQYTADFARSSVWKIIIDAPLRRRLKYGFRVRAHGTDFYFSENGLEPYSAEAVNRPHNHFFYPFIHDIDSPSVPKWVPGTVWYQIFPDRFCRADAGFAGNPPVLSANIENWDSGRPAHRNFFGGNLAGIRQKLPYLADLGISGLYLTPVFQSPSNHKYNTQDYFKIDEHFGDLQELKNLVSGAHSRGIRVMLDAVFNHAGEMHPFWQDVLKNQENSPYKDYFHINNFPVKDVSLKKQIPDFHTFAYNPAMPKWNTENPAARKYLLDAASYWINEGDIDGWRLDVANEVSLDFWREFSRLARSLKPDFYILGEVWHDASAWINPGYFDAAMNYPVEYAISDFFLKKTISAERFTERLITALSRYSDLHNRAAFNLLDSHDTDRALTRAKGDKQALKNAFTMLFLLPGSPCIYYGDEIGLEGGFDPDCRRPMIWNEEQDGPAGRQDLDLKQFFADLITFRRTFSSIINNNVLEYNHIDGADCWKFSGDGAALTAKYESGILKVYDTETR